MDFKIVTNETKVKCSKCGKDTTVPFVPDGRRPVYCVDCYREVKFKSKIFNEQKKTEKSLWSHTKEKPKNQVIGEDVGDKTSFSLYED